MNELYNTTKDAILGNLNSKSGDEDIVIPDKTSSSSEFGSLNYSVDVNPIVMTQDVDALDDPLEKQLKAQDEYFEKEEKKHRQSLLAMKKTGLDVERQLNKQVAKAKAKTNLPIKGELLQALANGENPYDLIDQKNHDNERYQKEQIKQLNRTDIEQQATGVDSNARQQARDDESSIVVNDTLAKNSNNSTAIDNETEIDTVNVNKESVDTGETQKTVVGQDDNTLGLSDSSSQNDNSIEDDLPDLLNDVMADFDIISAKQDVINSNNTTIPMIGLTLQLSNLPKTIKDRNGFVRDLSKKDLARIKQQLSKHVGKKIQSNVPIKTFNKIVGGNGQPTYDEVQLSTTILTGHHVDFSKAVNEKVPLKIQAPLSVDAISIKKNKTDSVDDFQKELSIKPDFNTFKTPIDLVSDSRELARVQRINQLNLDDYEHDLALKREDHSKQDVKLSQPSKNLDVIEKGDGPELDV